MIHDTEFSRLAKEDPEELIRLIESGTLKHTELTFAAEYLGGVEDDWRVPELLKRLTYHESVIVVEGAIYGLVRWANSDGGDAQYASMMLSHVAHDTESATIKRICESEIVELT